MRVADNKTQLRVADPTVAYRNGRPNARLEWGSSNIYGFTYFCGVLPKKFHFLQVLAKKSAGVSWRGVLVFNAAVGTFRLLPEVRFYLS